MRNCFVSLLILFSGATLIVNAQPGDDRIAKLNAYLAFLDNAGFSGQILVAEKGKVLENRNFGFANKETMFPITSNTAFNIGSLTKQFTASAILWLEQNGKLSTSDTLGTYWDTLSVDKKGITLHQLLTHTSGLRRQLGQQNGLSAEEDMLNVIFSSELLYVPGARFQYSNLGYQVLAAIVEKVSGIPFKEFIRQKFINPFGLTHTFFNSDDLYRNNHNVAIGYNEWKEVSNAGIQNNSWLNTGSSGILSTTEDMYKWFVLLQSGKIINPNQVVKLFTPAVTTDEEEKYGYGWFITKTSLGKQLIYHGGDISGYHTIFRYYPGDDRVIIVFTNQELFSLAVFKNRIASAISKILSDIEVEFPVSTYKPAMTELYPYCGTYTYDSINSFKVWLNGGQLTIGAWGQKATDLLIPDESSVDTILKAAVTKSKRLMDALVVHDDATAKEILGADGFEFYFPFARQNYDAWSGVMGESPNITYGGTIPAYWDSDDFARTYVRLELNDVRTTFFLGWTPKGMYDVTVNDDRPFPLIYPLVFDTDGKCMMYNIDAAKVIEIEFSKDKSGIVKDLRITDADRGSMHLRKVE